MQQTLSDQTRSGLTLKNAFLGRLVYFPKPFKIMILSRWEEIQKVLYAGRVKISILKHSFKIRLLSLRNELPEKYTERDLWSSWKFEDHDLGSPHTACCPLLCPMDTEVENYSRLP